MAEREEVYSSFVDRATKTLEDVFNSLESMSCNKIEGGVYLFPRIHLPPAAIKAAKADGLSPDVFYAVSLLEATGIAVVPGTGFHQANGIYHIRCTILPCKDKINAMISRLRTFHESFMKKFRER